MMSKFTINPNECKSGKSRGVTFRCNAHKDKKKDKKISRSNWKRIKNKIK